jgi:uncharacterized protein YdeI (YjbR/CyaY-like superfamily)
MASKIISIDQYLTEGCGRCKYFQTLQCKVHRWTDELQFLRAIVLKAGLTEELKWSMPCYTHNGKNILMVAALKDYCTLGFFKGALLTDEKKLLISPGENSNATRQFRFTDSKQIIKIERIILQYIKEAVEIEESGKKINALHRKEEPIIAELIEEFKLNPKLEAAFYKLTPGRQRGYLLYFSSAKQSATRVSRIQKYSAKILSGKGFHD